MLLPTHYTEVINSGGMTSGVAMVIYRGGNPLDVP